MRLLYEVTDRRGGPHGGGEVWEQCDALRSFPFWIPVLGTRERPVPRPRGVRGGAALATRSWDLFADCICACGKGATSSMKQFNSDNHRVLVFYFFISIF